MNESSSPSPKGGNDVPNISSFLTVHICQDARITTISKKKKSLLKLFSSRAHNHLHLINLPPLNLRIIPNSDAKVALEKRCCKSLAALY
jgi:hypothetical protein